MTIAPLDNPLTMQVSPYACAVCFYCYGVLRDLAVCVGMERDDGATGPAGADGNDGADGATGPAGPTGTQYTETSDITLNSLTLNSAASGLTLAGSTAITGSATIGGAFTVAGDTTLSGNFTVESDTTLNTLYSKYKVTPSISTLIDDVSGTIYICDLVNGNVTSTLPSISSIKVGTYYSFIVKATAITTNTLIINTPNNTVNIYGTETMGQTAGGIISSSASATTITVGMQNTIGRHLIKLIAIADDEWIVDAVVPQNLSIVYS